MVKKIVLGIVALFVGITIFGALLPEDENYDLSIVNATDVDATVVVAPSQDTWTVPAHGALVAKVGKKSDRDASPEQVFTITQNGQNSTVTGSVTQWGEYVLDITGDSCLVKADFGKLYAKAEDGGAAEVDVKDVIRTGKQFFKLEIKNAEGNYEFFDVPLGEPLPESVKASHGTKVPELLRLMAVPCPIVDMGGQVLADYMMNN